MTSIVQPKPTFRGATLVPFAAAAGTAPFFVIEGSATKHITVQRIIISCLSLTAVEFITVICQKLSTATTGGTATSLTLTPMENGQTASANTCKVYTVAPAAGALVGTIDSHRSIGTPTAAAAANTTADIIFDFRSQGENRPPALDGIAQGIILAFAAAPGSAVTMALAVEWCEEG